MCRNLFACGLFAVILMSSSLFAETVVTGPGAFAVSTAEDVSYVGEPLVVPSGAATTNYPGAFYPEGGEDHWAVAFHNVKISDIAMFSARIAKNGAFYTAGTFFMATNNGVVSCQFQIDDGNLFCAFVSFRQTGDDVEACVDEIRYAAKVGTQCYGADFTAFGVKRAFVENLLLASASGACALYDLGCILREDVAAPEIAPTEIRFENGDETEIQPTTYAHAPCLTNIGVRVARHVRVADLVGVDGEMSYARLNSGNWTPVSGHSLTNISDYVQINLMLADPVSDDGQVQRFAGIVRLDQDGEDVVARITWAGHSYDYQTVDDPIGPGFVGSEMGVTNVAKTAQLAFRNLNFRFQSQKAVIRQNHSCVMKSPVKLWSGAPLSEVTPFDAQIGGQVTGRAWKRCVPYFPTNTTDGGVSYLYEWQRDGWVEVVEVIMYDIGNDVWGKVNNVRYAYATAGVFDNRSTYLREITNDVTAVSALKNSKGTAYQCIVLSNLTASCDVRNRHTVTVDENFKPRYSPLYLDSFKLALTPTVGTEMTFDSMVRGYGALGVSGMVLLNADLPEGINLEVDSGTAVIATNRVVKWDVSVAQGAALGFRISNGVRPRLTAYDITFESGAKIVLTGSATDIPETGETFKLTSGCTLQEDVLNRVTLQSEGAFAQRYKAVLKVDADGDLAVKASPKRGFVVILR